MPRFKIASTAIFFNKYKPNSDSLYPIAIRVTFDRVKRYYDTGYRLSEDDYKNMSSAKSNSALYKVFLELIEKEGRARAIANELKDKFDFDIFEKLYFQQNSKSFVLLSNAFDNFINSIDKDRPGTINSYKDAKTSFFKFNAQLRTADITPKVLEAYEKSMLKDKRSYTTIGMYCRSLRALLNYLIAEGEFKRENYPFGLAKNKKYEIPTSVNKKKALTLEEIGKIYRHECKKASSMDMARDYWMFLYLANGINVKDFCLLRWSDIKGSKLTFVREKTKRTKKKVEPITIIMQPEMQTVINKWGDKKGHYIFKCLDEKMTATEVLTNVHLLVHVINENMKKIAKALEIDKPVTTYYARHSFATILKNSGAPVAMISQALGHSSLATTQNYLAGFEDDQLKDATAALRKF